MNYPLGCFAVKVETMTITLKKLICLRCGREFLSEDVKRNRLCDRCNKANLNAESKYNRTLPNDELQQKPRKKLDL